MLFTSHDELPCTRNELSLTRPEFLTSFSAGTATERWAAVGLGGRWARRPPRGERGRGWRWPLRRGEAAPWSPSELGCSPGPRSANPRAFPPTRPWDQGVDTVLEAGLGPRGAPSSYRALCGGARHGAGAQTALRALWGDGPSAILHPTPADCVSEISSTCQADFLQCLNILFPSPTSPIKL